ncbi:GNAT family N-acetyltransferase [Sinomicrobium sp.]
MTNNAVILRPVKETDSAVLPEIIRAVFEEYDAPKQGTVYSDPDTDELYRVFQKERSVLWVAEEDGKILGCCGIYPTPGLSENCAELVKFYLSAQARGKGIGSLLMQQSVKSAKTMGYTQLYIESLPHFATAVKMYEKQGFRRLNKPLGASGHTSCDIWMIKTLTL